MAVPDKAEILKLLTTNIEQEIEIQVEKDAASEWEKCLKDLPLFTIKEIEAYRLKSGKIKAIIKTRDRGKKFMEEGYISTDSIYTKKSKNCFDIKGTCRASMKAEKRQMNISLNLKTGSVIKGNCTCPAGKSGYCNHVMALLFQLADYSLHQIKTVPTEVACTNKHRQWGIPSDKYKYPMPVMHTKIFGDKKRGYKCTLYDPRLNATTQNNAEKYISLQNVLKEKDSRIGYAHVIDTEHPLTQTQYGLFHIGSPLSYQLSVFENDFKILSTLCTDTVNNDTDLSDIDLPTMKIPESYIAFPKSWGILNYTEISLLTKIFPETLENSHYLERQTIGQDTTDLWQKERALRITSSQANKVCSRKRNFESLAKSLKAPIPQPKFVKEALDFGKKYESVARTKFFQFMTYQLQRTVKIRNTGFVVQPNLFWLGASPDGLILDKLCEPALIEIKCP